MKKIFKTLVAVVAFAAATTSASAQLYVSGNFSMSHKGGEYEATNTKKAPDNKFRIGTEIGYYFTDNMAVGADIYFRHGKSYQDADKKYWDATNTFHFNPYFRFDFVSTEKISFGAKAEAILGFSKKKDQDDVTGKNSRFGVAIIPVLNYKFNSNWSAGVSFGNGGLSWRNTVNKDKDGNKIDNDSNLGVDLRLQSLNFSVVYTF
jgi:hypothetical protein